MENYGYTKTENTGPQQQTNIPYRSEKKLPAALLGILVGWLGLNKFYLGYTKEGIIQLVLNIVTCGIASIIPFIEGTSIFVWMTNSLMTPMFMGKSLGYN